MSGFEEDWAIRRGRSTHNVYTGPTIQLFPCWGTRYFRLTYEFPIEPPCPGEGICHGSLAWCRDCGPVDDVCDVVEWPDRCDCHERYPEGMKPFLGPPRQVGLPFPV